MNEIDNVKLQTPIEWNGQVVITTAQLAEVYGATTDNINDNFSRNKDRFKEGKHYIFLTGQVLREFKNQSADSGVVAKNASQLYLWTRRGASRHCKILGTDRAWEQFDYLEDNYFDSGKQQKVPMTIPEQIQIIAQGYGELHEEVKTIKEEMQDLKDNMPILPIEAEKITNSAKAKGVHVMGGKSSNAYANRSIVNAVYRDIYGQVYRNFGVKSYKAIKRNQTDKAIAVIEAYSPPIILQDRIDNENAQQRLDV